MIGEYKVIAPLGDRVGFGTFETFWATEKYPTVEDAFNNKDCVVVNFVQDNEGKIWFHFTDLAEPEHQLFYRLIIQHFDPKLGIDTRDDNAACNLYNMKFQNKK